MDTSVNLPALLVVEDDLDTQEMMQTILRNEYTVFVTGTGTEALRMLESNPIDIVLMDVLLGKDESGLDITRRIRLRWSSETLPVIALTARAFPAESYRCIQAGCNAHVAKPFRVNELRRTIREVLASAVPGRDS